MNISFKFNNVDKCEQCLSHSSKHKNQSNLICEQTESCQNWQKHKTNAINARIKSQDTKLQKVSINIETNFTEKRVFDKKNT